MLVLQVLLLQVQIQYSQLSHQQVAVVEAGLGGRDDATNVFPAANVVLAVLTTHKRHDLIETMRGHWLRDVKALLLTDRPGLRETARHKVVVYEGDPNCGAADRGAGEAQ